ncbi:Serine/threonine-protein kinase tel1 [Basidiobolus ranarum]|uniref:Serine/threonine-protein kinase tel1 n=1 Tax=Basidiobolus ranarum TaxID=34480 RepID=A0ABR2VWN2_9FUNG
MSLSSTISHYCTGFSSRVIKKRTESVHQLKELLSIDSNLLHIDQETWEHVILEFMTLIEMEQRDFLKKLGSASLATASVPARFKQLGTDFRWILKVCHSTSAQPLYRIIRDVYSHMIATLWLNRENLSDEQPFKNSSFAPDATRQNLEIFTPFLLDYSKALANHILTHRPYRDRLTRTLWDNLMYLFGSTLIGEKNPSISSQKTSGKPGLRNLKANGSRRSESIDLSSDETDVESDIEIAGSFDPSSGSDQGKSLFGAYSDISPQKPHSRYRGKVSTQQLGTNLAEVEVSKIICLLVASTYDWTREYGFNILCLFLTYFYCYPRETNTTPLILSAINSVICELTLNDIDISREFSLLFHATIVSLWNTKTLAVKVELICFVRLQFKQIYTCLDPYTLSEDQFNSVNVDALDKETINRLYDIYKCIQDDLAKSRNESVNPLLGRAYSFNFTSLLSTAPSTTNKSHPVAQTNESLGLTFGSHTPFRSKSNETQVCTWAMKSSDEQVGWRWVCMDFVADVYNQLILIEQSTWHLQRPSKKKVETNVPNKSYLNPFSTSSGHTLNSSGKRSIYEELPSSKRLKSNTSVLNEFPVLGEVMKTLSLASSSNSGLLVSLLQVFMSLNEKYPHRIISIPLPLMEHIQSALSNRNPHSIPELVIELLSSEDHTTLFWSLLCLKTFAESCIAFSKWIHRKDTTALAESSKKSDSQFDIYGFSNTTSQMWTKVWHQALQKVTSLYVGGAAVLVLNTLMISQLVPNAEMATSRKEISKFVPVLLSQNIVKGGSETEENQSTTEKDFTDNLIILLTNYSALVSFDIFSHSLDSTSSKQVRDVGWLKWIFTHMVGQSKFVSDIQSTEDGIQVFHVSPINDIEMCAEALLVPFLQTHTEHHSDLVNFTSTEEGDPDYESHRDVFIENRLKIQGYYRMGQLREIASTEILFEKRLRDVTALRELLDGGPLNVTGIQKITNDHKSESQDARNYRSDFRQKLCHELCILFSKTFSGIHSQIREYIRLIRDPDTMSDSLYAQMCRGLIYSIQISTLFNRIAMSLVSLDVTTFELLLEEPLMDEMNALWSLLHQAIRLLSNQSQYLTAIINVLKTHFEVKNIEAYPERQVWQQVVQPELWSSSSSCHEMNEPLWKFQIMNPTLLQYICNCLIEISLFEENIGHSIAPPSRIRGVSKKSNSMDFEDEFEKNASNSTKSGPTLVTTNPSLEYYDSHPIPLGRKLQLDALQILLHMQQSLFLYIRKDSHTLPEHRKQWKPILDMIQ